MSTVGQNGNTGCRFASDRSRQACASHMESRRLGTLHQAPLTIMIEAQKGYID